MICWQVEFWLTHSYRLFCPLSSTDEEDDESLSARIAGLNLLQLSLENLGLDIGSDPEEDLITTHARHKKRNEADLRLIRPGLEAIAKACGNELKKLEEPDRRSPKAKLDVLLQMHKIIVGACQITDESRAKFVVDRLGQLPPIPMKDDTPAEQPSIGPQGSIHEMTDDTRSLGGRSRPMSPEADPATPKPISRPASVFSNSENSVPEIHLPDSAISLPEDEDSKTPSHSEAATYFDRSHSTSSLNASPEIAPGPTSSSADLILPILIYSVVQANPQQLASHLAFVQRFRAENLFGGEGQYCLVNAQAVLEFLLTVDLEALGLSSDRILAA